MLGKFPRINRYIRSCLSDRTKEISNDTDQRPNTIICQLQQMCLDLLGQVQLKSYSQLPCILTISMSYVLSKLLNIRYYLMLKIGLRCVSRVSRPLTTMRNHCRQPCRQRTKILCMFFFYLEEIQARKRYREEKSVCIFPLKILDDLI